MAIIPCDPTLNELAARVAVLEILVEERKILAERTMNDLERRIDREFVLSSEAVAKAERTMNERLNSMNEFREALKEQAGRMATRVELEKVDMLVRELQNQKANLDGKLLVVSGSISTLIVIALWALSHVLHL